MTERLACGVVQFCAHVGCCTL